MFENMLGIGYFILYQIMGVRISTIGLKKEQMLYRILIGSVFGSALLQWVPALCSFFMGFNTFSHLLAFIITLIGTEVFCFIKKRKETKTEVVEKISWKKMFEKNAFYLIVIPLVVYFLVILSTHSIPANTNGSIHTGQATYGDMNMHLAFITSVAKQGVFPPEYSMLPGTRLSYPFLCDTISSSIYIWGTSLRVAYCLPMIFAFLQVVLGALCLAKEILKSRNKAMLAWAFFFLNGGFGIWYFINGATKNPQIFTRIFTEFYKTPTNYVDGNIRWVNIVVDMLLPQRATLFGWAVLFPTMTLLYKAIQNNKRSYFVVAGMLAGALPMIHTHSFLALGFVCAMWLIYSIRTKVNQDWKKRPSKIELILLFVFFFIMCLLDIIRKSVEIPANIYMIIAFVGIAFIGMCSLFFVQKGWKTNDDSKKLVLNWGIFLAVVLVFAVPQLVTWTFQQAQGEHFMRGFFNWANQNDSYLTFYFKNIGIVWMICILAILFTSARNYAIIAPSFFIWFVAELIVFQPNEYDNNKLLYVGYLFLCMFAADYIIEIVRKIKKRYISVMIISIVLILSSSSALLTMGREVVSDYELYGKDEVAMCRYISEHTEAKDVILTDTRHNNGVVSLTGRNIVCGSSSFLYYHGVNYQKQEADVSKMYNDPENDALFKKYHVKYIYIGPSERKNYVIVTEMGFLKNYHVIHQEGEVVLYERND